MTSTRPTTLQDGSILPPTGKKAVLPYVAIYEVKDGLLISDRIYWDRMTSSRGLAGK